MKQSLGYVWLAVYGVLLNSKLNHIDLSFALVNMKFTI